MKRKYSIPIVFFNASVILSGIRSPSGGSGELLKRTKQKNIRGVISEIIFDEIIRHADKFNLTQSKLAIFTQTIFPTIQRAPKKETVSKFNTLVIDAGDAHVLASAKETHAQWLVTLDKKHLLILQKKIKWIRIVSPKELLENFHKTVDTLRKNSN